MSLRRIEEDKSDDCRVELCQSRAHNPPNMMVLENGLYEWTCPDCGHSMQFRVNRPAWEQP